MRSRPYSLVRGRLGGLPARGSKGFEEMGQHGTNRDDAAPIPAELRRETLTLASFVPAFALIYVNQGPASVKLV